LAYPKTFRAWQIAANDTKLNVSVGGGGPAVVLLYGYGEAGDMWVPLANDLARDHTVVVPDLRGMGLSAKPAGGCDKKRKLATLQVSSMHKRSVALGRISPEDVAHVSPPSRTGHNR
jgi:pimeloyl-ACP methyl ester carboxylesterase